MSVARPPLFRMRAIVRDYVLEHLYDNPDATVESAIPAIKDRIRGDFSVSPWLEVLLRLVEILLPLLLPLIILQEDSQ